MKLLKVVVLCVFTVSVVCAADAETKESVKVEDAKDADGVCVSKEQCASESESDESKNEASEKKYTKEKQEETRKEDEPEATKDEGVKDEGEKDKAEGDEKKEGEEKKEEAPKKGEEERHLVKIEVLEEGKWCDKVKATNDDAVTVHLRGYKASDNSEFITTYKKDGSEGLSIPFRMGVGDSIKGLELGVIGMCVDELRRLTVPASLVRNGREEFKGDKIPRGEDLIFEVRLLGAVPNYMKGMTNLFRKYDTNEDGLVQREEIYNAIVGDGKMFPRGAPVVDELTDEQMEKMDKNKDGVIQWEEFNLPKWDEV